MISCLLSRLEWAALERERRLDPRALVLPCCKTAAYQRVGAHGTAHFVHQPGTACDTAPESAEHLRAKADIAHACHALGWTPVTEFRGRDWVADVLARKGDRKVAFEVQMSAQTSRETRLRHDRYARDGIRDCWLFAKLPAGLEADGNVPSFHLLADGVEKEASVEVGPAVFALRQFVGLYLSRQVRFSRHLVARTQQKVGIVFFAEILYCH
ncbi:MAG: hypothetical protein HY303_14550 [Candidatus Wallbacteria bacterium]|nr:hypothetical protein [Candidatus Wallbacteria bacterium]